MVVSGRCSNEEDVLCSDPSLDTAVLRSSHKEADTRFVLYEVGHIDNVVVSAPDTGVLLLLLAHSVKLSSKVWTWTGASKKPKYVPLEEVSATPLITRQVYCYNFTPSPAMTAPRSLICGH